MTAELRLYETVEADGYPREWHDLGAGVGIKDLVRSAAGDRCERCGHPYFRGAGEWSPCDHLCAHEGQLRYRLSDEDHCTWVSDGSAADIFAFAPEALVEARWRILTVHHLNMVKRDCRWWNLAALCQRCHLQVQARVRMGQVWVWEHSEWFKPHAAGYYAFAYLGLELSREETLARLDELLALERAA